MTEISTAETKKFFLRGRDPETHKGDYGKAVVIAGSSGMTGAAVLASRACVHSGAGLVYMLVPGACLNTAEILVPEAVKRTPGGNRPCFDESDAAEAVKIASFADCVAIGPGLGRDSSTGAFVRELLSSPGFAPKARALVVDADALYPFYGDPEGLKKAAEAHPGKLVITPHEGEAAGLLGVTPETVRTDRKKAVETLAGALCGGIALLKGHRTLIGTEKDGRIELYVNVTGNPGMATGGSGDVLTGIIAGFAAADGNCEELLNIVKYGAAAHGIAGDIAAEKLSERYISAADIIDGLGEIKNYA